ncbi:hypothetical protein V1504DRAFT_495679 [Lipomyces starkeyi]
MQGVSECSPQVDGDLPLPPRRFLIKDVAAPQSVYVLGTTFTLYSPEGSVSTYEVPVIHRLSSLRLKSPMSRLVSKFFDPLFVSVDELPSDNAPAKFRQIVTVGCCGQEVAAYSSLSSLQGTAIPSFYVEFACHFPQRPIESDRTVEVIVMEHIDGWPLSCYSPGELTESQARWIVDRLKPSCVRSIPTA